MNLSSKSFKILSTIACIFSFLFAATTIFILIYPPRIISINTPVKIVNPKVACSEEVKYDIHYIKYCKIPDEISQELYVNDMNVCSHKVTNKDLPIGEGEILLGMLTPPCGHGYSGKAKIKLIFRYKLYNGLRIYTKTVETEDFTLLKKRGGHE